MNKGWRSAGLLTVLVAAVACGSAAPNEADDSVDKTVGSSASALETARSTSTRSVTGARDKIDDFIKPYSDPVTYCPSYDCDDFAYNFDKWCEANEKEGMACCQANIFCTGGGHAINIVCTDGLCCGVEPQPTGGKPGPPHIIPGTCFFHEGTSCPSVNDAQCSALCKGSGLGKPKGGCTVADEIPRDKTDPPSSKSCSENNGSNTCTGCLGCCNDTLLSWEGVTTREGREASPWWTSCRAWCTDAYGPSCGP